MEATGRKGFGGGTGGGTVHGHHLSAVWSLPWNECPWTWSLLLVKAGGTRLPEGEATFSFKEEGNLRRMGVPGAFPSS